MNIDAAANWLASTAQYIVVACVGWIYAGYQKMHKRIDKLQSRVEELEINAEVSKVMIKNISEDVKEIKEGVNLLISDKLHEKHRNKG